MGKVSWLSPQGLEGHNHVRGGDCLVFGGTVHYSPLTYARLTCYT